MPYSHVLYTGTLLRSGRVNRRGQCAWSPHCPACWRAAWWSAWWPRTWFESAQWPVAWDAWRCWSWRSGVREPGAQQGAATAMWLPRGGKTFFLKGIVKWYAQRCSVVVQCCGSMTIWCGSGSADPCLWLMDPDADPDPSILIIVLQDANKKII